MKNAEPLFDSATLYRIEVQGRVDVDWLQNFDSSAEVIFDERPGKWKMSPCTPINRAACL